MSAPDAARGKPETAVDFRQRIYREAGKLPRRDEAVAYAIGAAEAQFDRAETAERALAAERSIAADAAYDAVCSRHNLVEAEARIEKLRRRLARAKGERDAAQLARAEQAVAFREAQRDALRDVVATLVQEANAAGLGKAREAEKLSGRRATWALMEEFVRGVTKNREAQS